MVFFGHPNTIIIQHAEQKNPVHVPGRYMTDDLRDIVRHIDHHKISCLPDRTFHSAQHLTHKRILQKGNIPVLSGLEYDPYDLGFVLRQIAGVDIRHIFHFLQKFLYFLDRIRADFLRLPVDHI